MTPKTDNGDFSRYSQTLTKQPTTTHARRLPIHTNR